MSRATWSLSALGNCTLSKLAVSGRLMFQVKAVVKSTPAVTLVLIAADLPIVCTIVLLSWHYARRERVMSPSDTRTKKSNRVTTPRGRRDGSESGAGKQRCLGVNGG